MLQNVPMALRQEMVDRAHAILQKRRSEISNRGELEGSLSKFHRQAWPTFDPAAYRHNWSIDALADHLTGVMQGHIRIFICTQPPRTMKSSMIGATYIPYIWAQSKILPLAGPHVKYIGIAYDPDLSVRDATKARRVIDSPWYRDRWGDRYQIARDQDRMDNYGNTAGGFRFSTSIGGKITGEGADIIGIDDPINARKANWDSARLDVNTFWDETLPTRLNDQRTGAFIIMMQRLHEDDLVGHILETANYDRDDIVHLNLPMEFDPALDTRTWINGKLFFEDPREEEDELLWPERFPRDVVDKLKTSLGPFAASAQLQQSPAPRGGAIIDRMQWQVWDEDAYKRSKGAEYAEGGILRYPPCSLIVGSIDTAYAEKEKEQANAWHAMTVFGVFEDIRDRTNVVMMEGWRNRDPLRGYPPDGLETDEERREYWGLSEKVADTIRRRRIDICLIENKTKGGDLEKEVRRLLRGTECQLILIEPEGNKVARAYAVQPIFADRRVYSPERAWAETVMTECAQFPKGKFKDYVDTVTQALSWLRNSGILLLGLEADEENREASLFRSPAPPPYNV